MFEQACQFHNIEEDSLIGSKVGIWILRGQEPDSAGNWKCPSNWPDHLIHVYPKQRHFEERETRIFPLPICEYQIEKFSYMSFQIGLLFTLFRQRINNSRHRRRRNFTPVIRDLLYFLLAQFSAQRKKQKLHWKQSRLLPHLLIGI